MYKKIKCLLVVLGLVWFIPKLSFAQGTNISPTSAAILVPPLAPTVTPVNTSPGNNTGSATYYMVCHDYSSNTSAPSLATTISNGPNVLNGSSFNLISWNEARCQTVDILKTNTSTYLVKGVVGNSYADTGQATGTYTSAGPAGEILVPTGVTLATRTFWASNAGAGQTTATTTFFSASGNTTNNTTEAATMELPVQLAGTLKNFYCWDSAAPGTSKSDAFTVRTSTSLGGTMATVAPTCTISGATATSCSDTTDTVALAAGTVLDIQDVTTSTPSARTIGCNLEIDY